MSKGPQPDWDPDIVAALDDDFNFEDPDNQLDDDFFTVANADQPPPHGMGEQKRQEYRYDQICYCA